MEIKPVERAPDRFGENPFKPKVSPSGQDFLLKTRRKISHPEETDAMKNEFERSRHRLLEESVPVKAKIPDGGQKKGLHPEGSNNIHKSTITATASM